MEDSADRLGRMADVLRVLATNSAHLRRLAKGIAPDGSEADREIEEWKRDHGQADEVQAALSSGQQSLVAAEEMILGLAAVCDRRVTAPFSVASLSRAVLQAAARAFWLLEPGIGAKARAVRFMNDLHRTNEAALGFAAPRGLSQDAREAGERLRLSVQKFFEVEGRRRRSTDEASMLNHAVRATAKENRAEYRDNTIDPDVWEQRARLVHWFLHKAVHGDKVALDTTVSWASGDRAGDADLRYPDTVFEECLGLVLVVFVAAARAAITTLGWDEGPWHAIVAGRLVPVLAELDTFVEEQRGKRPTKPTLGTGP